MSKMLGQTYPHRISGGLSVTLRGLLVSLFLWGIIFGALGDIGLWRALLRPVRAQESNPWRPYQLGPATSIVEDLRGNIWIATTTRGVIRFSGGFPKTFGDGLPSTRVNVVFVDQARNLLAGTSRGAVS